MSKWWCAVVQLQCLSVVEVVGFLPEGTAVEYEDEVKLMGRVLSGGLG